MHITHLTSSDAINLASFQVYPVFCSSVCVNNNTRMQKSSKKWGRPGIIDHVSDVRWTQGGRMEGGARSRFSRSWIKMKLCRASGVSTSCEVFEPSRLDDQRPVFKLICGRAPPPYIHLTASLGPRPKPTPAQIASSITRGWKRSALGLVWVWDRDYLTSCM